jgi:uncharacterized phage infection (PIP) family protein YhgE
VTNLLVEPLKTSSEQVRNIIDKLATNVVSKLEDTGQKLKTEQEKLTAASENVTSSLDDVGQRLRAMQMPDGIIEIKLQPFIGGLTKAINNHSKATADQIADLQKTVAQFDKSVRELPEHTGLTKAINDHSKVTADQTADLQETVTQFDKSISQLAERMSEAERRRAEDQVSLRDLISRLVLEVAESRRDLTELKKVSATTPASRHERGETRWPWFRGGSP